MQLAPTPVQAPSEARARRTQPGVWSRLQAIDFSRGWAAAVLAVVFVTSRLPWIRMGYGSDPDAWRVAMSARYLLEHGSYLPSRLPGYPVHDIAMAALLRGGWTLTNASSVAISVVGVIVFALLVRRLELPAPGLLTVTFAFLPLLWSTSVATLDYSWALTFFLGAYLAETDDRPLLGGVLLGLAGGCRVSYLAFALPLMLLYWQRGRPREIVQFLGATGLTWLLVFSPIWLRYGTQFWNFYDVRPDWGDVFHALTEGSAGLLPLLLIVVCMVASWRELRRLPSLLRDDADAAAWALIVFLALFVFIRLPLQTYYLMPAAPFALLLLARLCRPRWLTVACVALVLGGFVDIYTAHPSGWRSPAALVSIRPTAGLVLQDYRLRRDRLELVRRVPQFGLPPNSVLTAGFYFPMLAELYHSQLTLVLPDGYLTKIGPLTDNARATDEHGVTYVWLLSQGDARNLLRQGFSLYSLDFSRETRSPAAIPIYHPENERFGIH